MLLKIITFTHLTLAVLLIATVLLQQKGSGLGAAFGGSSNIYSTKRGVDKIIFRSTIVIAVLFFGVSLATVIL